MKVYMVRSDYGPDGDWNFLGLYATEAAANEYLALDKAANGYSWNLVEEIEVEDAVSREDRARLEKEGEDRRAELERREARLAARTPEEVEMDERMEQITREMSRQITEAYIGSREPLASRLDKLVGTGVGFTFDVPTFRAKIVDLKDSDLNE